MIKDTNNTAIFYQNLYKGIDAGLNKVGRTLRDRIKDVTPVDTGLLKKSMLFQRISGKEIAVTNDVFYAIFVEGGTIYMDGRFMMQRTFDNNQKELEQLFIDTINQFIQ